MSDACATRSLERLEAAGDEGLAMGRLVDALVDEGFDEVEAEAVIWGLMQRREVTPHGYVRRRLRRSGGAGGEESFHRVYEYVLRRWSPELDAQLELPGT